MKKRALKNKLILATVFFTFTPVAFAGNSAQLGESHAPNGGFYCAAKAEYKRLEEQRIEAERRAREAQQSQQGG